MIRILDKLRPARNRVSRRNPVSTRRRAALNVEALEGRITPIIAILIGHPVVPLALEVANTQQPVPPAPLVQLDPIPIFSQLMSGGPQQGSTALMMNGQACADVNEVLTLPGAPGPNSDPIIIFYRYRLNGVAEEMVTPPTFAAPGSFSINFFVTGRVEENFRDAPVGGPPQWVGKVDALVSFHAVMSGTWQQDAQGAIIIEGGYTADTAIHQTETIDQTEILIGLLHTWKVDAVVHTTGQGEEFCRKASGPDGALLKCTALSAPTVQISATVAPMSASGASAPPAVYMIQAMYMGESSTQGMALGSGVGGHGQGDVEFQWGASNPSGSKGALSETVTPPSGNPYVVTAAVDTSTSGREHVVPTVVLDAPVALAPSGFVTTTTPTFSWTAVNGATYYFFTIVDLTNPEVIIGTVTTNSFTPSSSTLLTPGDTYSWYVQALDNAGDASAFSNSLEFSVAFGSG
jgi:hypothetical protein